MDKPLILISNDDGIDSPGLIATIKALRPLGDLLIAVPVSQQTSMSRAYPKIPNLGSIETRYLDIDGEQIQAFAINGSPAYCVSYAVLELANRGIALCVSGINYGENVGLSLMPSGTIGAAFEADTYDIPAIAVSLEVPSDQHHSSEFQEHSWAASMHFLTRLANIVLKKGYIPEIGVWNLNVPASATEKTPWKITRQSRQNYFVFRKPKREALTDAAKLKVEIEIDFKRLEPDSDISCIVVEKCVSVTPLTWDMTAERMVELESKSLLGE